MHSNQHLHNASIANAVRWNRTFFWMAFWCPFRRIGKHAIYCQPIATWAWEQCEHYPYERLVECPLGASLHDPCGALIG